jgi:hypothetical protein
LFTVEIVAEGVAEVQLDDTRVCPRFGPRGVGHRDVPLKGVIHFVKTVLKRLLILGAPILWRRYQQRRKR